MKDYYQILGVDRFATAEEIKWAYRALAKRFHPDLNPGNYFAEERFKEISRAYDTLSDPAERKRYDYKLLYGGPYRNAVKTPAEPGNEKDELRREYLKREAWQRHVAKKKKQDEMYKRRAVIASVCIILVFFIGLKITSAERSERERRMQEFVDKHQGLFLQMEPVGRYFSRDIHTADSPYDSIFGEGRYEEFSDNSLLISNQLKKDVVVCLQEAKEGGQTIRNEFIHSGDVYKMGHLPNGRYSIRLALGQDWDPSAETGIGHIKGAFRNGAVFLAASYPPFTMQKTYEKNLNHFSSYGIILNDSIVRKFKPLAPAEFFR